MRLDVRLENEKRHNRVFRRRLSELVGFPPMAIVEGLFRAAKERDGCFAVHSAYR